MPGRDMRAGTKGRVHAPEPFRVNLVVGVEHGYRIMLLVTNPVKPPCKDIAFSP